MMTHNMLSKAEYDSISQIRTKLDIHVEENYDGQAQYFREYIASYLKDWASDNGYDLYSSGLKIYTTIDSRMQKYAEEAATKQMRKIQQDFNNHWRGEDPWRDENGQLVPGFIEGIAEKQPFYKKLLEKYPNQPDSVLYYLNKPHPVKLFDYEKRTHYQRDVLTRFNQIHGKIHALFNDCDGTSDWCCSSMGWRCRFQNLEV